jgi:hypothetical protein
VKPSKPSTHGPNGRDASGRFTLGNREGKGNPLAGRAAKIRAVLLRKLTPKRAATIADKLIAMAEAGDLAAMKELWDRTIGRASPLELLERVEALEQAMILRRFNGGN